MAHNPAVFNASAFFGDSNTQKGQQDPFWNQHPSSANHSSGFFDGTAAPIDPFMSNTQGYVDGWDDHEWPEDDDFLGDDSALQNHVVQDSLDTPKLIVPNHDDSISSSSSFDSTPNGMDPELNAWVEEETSPYAQPTYQNTASYYAHQPDTTAQHAKTYASVCQTGMAETPNHQDLQAPQTSQQAFGVPDEPNQQENTLSPEPWSREPELGSWSPVFNHDSGPFLSSQQEGYSSSSFAIGSVGYPNDQEVVADSSQQGGTTMAPSQNYWPPSMSSQQEVPSSSAHLFANNGGYTPNNLQDTSHPLHNSFQQVGPATAPAQGYWMPTVPSQQEMQSSPAQLFADNGGYLPNDRRQGKEPSGDPGPAAASAQNYLTPSMTSPQEVPLSSAHLFADNGGYPPGDLQDSSDTSCDSFQQPSPATAPAQNYWTPAVSSQQQVAPLSNQLFADNGSYPPSDQQETHTPSGDSFQQVGPATAPAQNYWTPTVSSQQQVPQSSNQLFADHGGYPSIDQQETQTPSGDSFQQVGPAAAVAQDYWRPMVPSQKEMQPSPAQLFAGNSECPPNDKKDTLVPTSDSVQQVGPTMAPAQDYWTHTVPSQQEMQSSPVQLFADLKEGIESSGDLFQNVVPAAASAQNYLTPSMTSAQEVLSSSAHLYADNGGYPSSDLQNSSDAAHDSFQQVGPATTPAQNYCTPTMSSQQQVPPSSNQLFADNGGYPPSDRIETHTPSGDFFQQVGPATAPAQNYFTPTVPSQQQVSPSSNQLFADGGEHLSTGQEQSPGLATDSLQQVDTANAPAQNYWTPTTTSEQQVPLSTTQNLAYSGEYTPTGQQTPTPSIGSFQQVGTTTAPVQNYWTPTVTSQQEVSSSAAQLFADNGGYLPIGQPPVPRLPTDSFQQVGRAVASTQEDWTPNVTSDQQEQLSSAHADSFVVDNTSQQNVANASGQEEEQESALELLTEKDIQQANLWGNLPVIPHVRDTKPPVVENHVDQEQIPQPHQMESSFNEPGAEALNQQRGQVPPPPFKMESSFNDLHGSKFPAVMSKSVPEVGTVGLLYQTDHVVEENQPPVNVEGVVLNYSQPSFQDQQVTGDVSPTPELQELLPAPTEQTVNEDFTVEPDSPRDALQAAFLQKQLAGKAPAASPRTSLWMNTNTVLPTSCVLAPAAIVPPAETAKLHNSDQKPPADKQQKRQPLQGMPALVPITGMTALLQDTAASTAQEDPVDVVPSLSNSDQQQVEAAEQLNTGINQSNLNTHLPTSSELPVHNATRQQSIVQEVPNQVPNNNPQAASEVSLPPLVTALFQEQRTESSQMSLASLLQGGKSRPKKKTSQPSATSSLNTDPGLLQNASNPSAASNPSIPPSIPLSTADQLHLASGESSQDLSQSVDNQSLNSTRRTEELEHSRERDYNDSRDRPWSPEDSYHQNRRDPYYHEDHRDQYGDHGRQDRYYEQERDYDRAYHGRRDPERRSYDRRRDFDRRESDYGRRPYDREYDRRGYDGRDHTRRDSYDNRDSYYGHGYSSRQGRRGYDEHRSSREDLYRGSYHSGRSTPSSDRNSPASYDYSAYPSHQYGYPSYTDQQSMDLYQYQYLMYLYQFHPQHYEQYCAQLGYYNMGYTPEQLAQYYGGMYNSAGYPGTEATEQAPLEETPKTEPERFTPMLYRVQHPLVKFSGGRLLSLIGGEDDESPRCTIASVQMTFSIEEIEVIKLFPGPLSSRYSSRTEVMTYCERRSAGTSLSGDGVVKSLVWKILANLVKHNGAFVAAELAEIIMENWRSCNSYTQHEFISPEGCPPAEIDSHKHIQVYREMLLAGATKDALEYCMRTALWGHAMLLASKMDRKVHNDVTNRFMKTMTDFDPIRTVYDHLSGRQPVALMTTDDWQRNLAAMVANPPRQHPQCIKKNMMCLGDTLMSNEQVWEAHLCYLLAGEHFGYPTEEKTKMSMIGLDHRTTVISDRYLPLENLQMMEVLEYAVSLSNDEHHIPVLQSYKFMHLNKLSEAGFTEEALHYAELIGHTIIKHPINMNSTLVKNIREVIDRLNPETQEASEMIEMLDKVLQAKNSPSQISSSITESESEAEEPLAESSASFFSGYDPSTNTPKHQAEPVEDVQPQLSYTEPPVSAPPVHQESMPADVHQDSWSSSMATGVPQKSWTTSMDAGITQESWSGGMDSQVAQPELPSTMVPQAPEPATVPAPPPQPPLFVPGPPVTQPFPGQVGGEQLETAEEQPVYGRQWSEGARYEEAKEVEPMPAKETEPPKKAEEKPKSPEKRKEAKRNSPIGGWLSGLLSKVMPRGPNEMILPDDTKKSIYWDEKLKRWVNTEEDEQDKAPPPPPPTDMQLGAGRPPMMPLGNAVTAGATTRGLGGPVSTPFSPPSVQAPGLTQPITRGGIPAGMATPPSVSKFSRKAHGGGRLAKKYVDVLNPSGQSSNGPAMLPSSLLPTFPAPIMDLNPAQLFVPAPVNAFEDTAATLPTAEPVVGNPGSRPSSRNDDEDGGDQQSQHSRSSSVSLTSAEVRSYMMPQVPDPPPQNVAPVFYDPSSFTQPRAQATPRKSRYPGQLRK